MGYNPYTGEPAPYVVGPAAVSEPPVTAPTAPPAPPDINPEVVSQSAAPDPAADVPEAVVPSVEERLAAIEVRLFGWHH